MGGADWVSKVNAAVIPGLNLSSKKSECLQGQSRWRAILISIAKLKRYRPATRHLVDLHRLARELGVREEECRNVMCMATWTSISGHHSVVHVVLQRLPEAARFPYNCTLHLSA
jgi:hypothetical protein